MQILKSFEHSDYRLLWTNTFLTSLGRNTQNVLMSWLVLEMTDSPALLGVSMAVMWVPMAFGAIFGVVADRINRRSILIVLNLLSAALPFILGTLLILDLAQYWHLVLFSLLGGVAWASQGPARQVYSLDLVGESNIANATSLNQLAMRTSNLLGSFLIGVLVSFVDTAFFFYLIGSIYLIALVLLLLIRTRIDNTATWTSDKSVLGDLIEGLRYVGHVRVILGMQLIALVANIFEFPIRFTLLPVFARDVLKVGAAGLGWLNAASGLGAIVALVGLAVISDFRSKGLLLTISSMMWGFFDFGFAASSWYPLSVLFLVGSNISSAFCMVLISTLLLIQSSPEMRGRVIGVRSLVVFPLSTGNLMAGMLAQIFRAPITVAFLSVSYTLSVLSIILLIPKIRKSE